MVGHSWERMADRMVDFSELSDWERMVNSMAYLAWMVCSRMFSASMVMMSAWVVWRGAMTLKAVTMMVAWAAECFVAAFRMLAEAGLCNLVE